MAEGKVLQVIIFALLTGLALGHMGDSGNKLLNFFQDINTMIMKMIILQTKKMIVIIMKHLKHGKIQN